MMQSSGRKKPCPRCGTLAILIMDIGDLIPRLDALGYPQYYCPSCQHVCSPYEQREETESEQSPDPDKQDH
jgi:hypothetical protein